MTRIGKWLVGLCTSMIALALSTPAFAQAAEASGKATRDGMIGLAAGLGLGLAALGGALGQSRAAAAALDSIGRNPGASGKIFTPMLLALAFMESLVIFTLILAYTLSGNIGK